jgi:hypothetical protein
VVLVARQYPTRHCPRPGLKELVDEFLDHRRGETGELRRADHRLYVEIRVLAALTHCRPFEPVALATLNP